MAEQKGKQGGFPDNQTTGQDTHSTTGDGHPPRPGEAGYEEGKTQGGMAGQGTGQKGGPAGQGSTGGTGGYGGTSGGSGGGSGS